MLLDISRALRAPGEEIPFQHRDEIPPQEIFGETVTFDPPLLSGFFSVTGDSLRIWGKLTCTAHGHCAGCLKEVKSQVEAPFDEVFVRLGRYPLEEKEPEEEQMVYEGSKVELSHLALTLTLLELPMRFICGEDCPALKAMEPGETPSACQEDMPDQHPFSALQQLLNKDQEV